MVALSMMNFDDDVGTLAGKSAWKKSAKRINETNLTNCILRKHSMFCYDEMQKIYFVLEKIGKRSSANPS